MGYLSFGLAACIMLMSLLLFFQKPVVPVGIRTARSSTKKSSNVSKKAWKSTVEREFNSLEKMYPNQMGIYIKDLKTGEEFTRRSNEHWYLASGIKIPVAIEALKQIDIGRFSLHQPIELIEQDFVDGPGSTNFSRPGTSVSMEFLLEQMLVHSDNTASDALIRLVGLDQINELVQVIGQDGFTRITSLKDVRRNVYSELHPKARILTGRDFMELKSIPQMGKKLEKFAEILNLEKTHLKLPHVHNAFMEYYKKNYNSATLRGFGQLLEYTVDNNRLLSDSSKEFLIDNLMTTDSGKNGIRGGLSKAAAYAHKTGKQYMRVNDFGMMWNRSALDEKPVIVVVCTRNFQTVDIAEKVLRRIGAAVQSSGLV